jgi:DNA-binding transcriptional LysR family regulator
VPDTGEYRTRVVSIESRWIALPAPHPLAGRESVEFAEVAGEEFVALPAAAGSLRDFWLATDQRAEPARVAVEAETADETMEAVASGLGVVLLAEGNIEPYRRGDIAFRPVTGLPPCELAVVWRAGDTRRAVRVFAESCVRCLCDGEAA